MSELTRCNYCVLQSIKAHAKQEGKKVMLKSSAFKGGIDVFVLPLGVDLPHDTGMGSDARDEYFRAWLMEVTEECVC